MKDPKAFMEYSNSMKDVYNSTGENNPEKERKVLIMFDDVIADMFINKTFT